MSDRDLVRGLAKQDRLERLHKRTYPVGSQVEDMAGTVHKIVSHRGSTIVTDHGFLHSTKIKRVISEEHKQAAKVRQNHMDMKRATGKWDKKKHAIKADLVFPRGRAMLATFLKSYKDGTLNMKKSEGEVGFPAISQDAAWSTAARNNLKGKFKKIAKKR